MDPNTQQEQPPSHQDTTANPHRRSLLDTVEELSRKGGYVLLGSAQVVDAANVMVNPLSLQSALQELVRSHQSPRCLCTAQWPALAISRDPYGLLRVHLPRDAAAPPPEGQTPGPGVHSVHCLFREPLAQPRYAADADKTGQDGQPQWADPAHALDADAEEDDQDGQPEWSDPDAALDADTQGDEPGRRALGWGDGMDSFQRKRRELRVAFLRQQAHRAAFSLVQTVLPADEQPVPDSDRMAPPPRPHAGQLLAALWQQAQLNVWRGGGKPPRLKSLHEIALHLKPIAYRLFDDCGQLRDRILVSLPDQPARWEREDPEAMYTRAERQRIRDRRKQFLEQLAGHAGKPRHHRPPFYVMGIVSDLRQTRDKRNWQLDLLGIEGISVQVRENPQARMLRQINPDVWKQLASPPLRHPAGSSELREELRERAVANNRRRWDKRLNLVALARVTDYHAALAPGNRQQVVSLRAQQVALMLTTTDLLPVASARDAHILHTLCRMGPAVMVPLNDPQGEIAPPLAQVLVRRRGAQLTWLQAIQTNEIDRAVERLQSQRAQGAAPVEPGEQDFEPSRIDPDDDDAPID